jgi:hypothetical protein
MSIPVNAEDAILACKIIVEQLLKRDVNDWFLALEPGRQQVLVEDKWMLAGAAYKAGIELALAEVTRCEAYIAERAKGDGGKPT